MQSDTSLESGDRSGASIASEDDLRRCRQAMDRWAADRLAEEGDVVAVEHDEGGLRWLVRLKGDEKDFVTVGLTIRQRTLHHEAPGMPAPETNTAQVFEYLLRKNAGLYQIRFALGPEDAVYLVGEVPVSEVNDEVLDRIVGSSVAYIDMYFPTAMQIGFEGMYKRRRPRR